MHKIFFLFIYFVEALNSMATVADVHVNNKSVQLHHSEDTALTGFEVRNAKLKFLHQFKTPCWIEPFTGSYHPVHTTIRVDKDWGLNQIDEDSSQSRLSVHTTESNLDWKVLKLGTVKAPNIA